MKKRTTELNASACRRALEAYNRGNTEKAKDLLVRVTHWFLACYLMEPGVLLWPEAKKITDELKGKIEI
jgi:hypothetical protein